MQNVAIYIKHAQKNTDFFFGVSVTGNWFQSALWVFFCVIDEKTYRLRKVENFTLFISYLSE